MICVKTLCMSFKKCFIVQIQYYNQIKMCYDFEIHEKVKEKSRKAQSKEDQEIELEIKPMTISN